MEVNEKQGTSIELLVCTSAERLPPTSPSQVALSASIVNEPAGRGRVSKDFKEGRSLAGRKRTLHGDPVNESKAARFIADNGQQVNGRSTRLKVQRELGKLAAAQAKTAALFSPSVREKCKLPEAKPNEVQVVSLGSLDLVKEEPDVVAKEEQGLAKEEPDVVVKEELKMSKEEENKEESSEKIGIEELPDIDSVDLGDPLLCGHYVVDMYQWYKDYEKQLLVKPDFLADQEQINQAMRKVAVNWLIEAHHVMKLKPETLFLSVAYMDRYMAKAQVLKKELQLLAGTSLYLSAKYEETHAPTTKDVVTMMQSKHTTGQILAMEKSLFTVLDGWFAAPTVSIFLRRHIRTVGYEKHPELLTYCEYLSELSLYEYELLHIPPSQISAAIVLLTRVSFEEVPTFPEALRAHSQCTYDEVLPIAQKLVETLTKFQRGAGRSGKRLYVVEKFDSARRHRVSRRAVPVF